MQGRPEEERGTRRADLSECRHPTGILEEWLAPIRYVTLHHTPSYLYCEPRLISERLPGVNTGFGGNADTRTEDHTGLQRALMQLTQSAVLTTEDIGTHGSCHEYLETHAMPSAWTRGAMLLRANANIRGHSAISKGVLETLLELLNRDIIPVVPLRGSISASGDLMPLSYIAGALQGSPDVFVRIGGRSGRPTVISAYHALKEASITPIVLAPKEELSLINGTAVAAAVASLSLYEANQLAAIAQVLTALTSEALHANVGWAHPFIAAIRPHEGQIETAQNLRTCWIGSKLVYGLQKTKDGPQGGLAQERYALRSSPQWLAPVLEDLQSAQRQLTVELNSTSDNPVVNIHDNDVHCGANFQATSVTAATEKVRLSLQLIGKMLFAQTTELINHNMSHGLPPNLAADDPSLSFCLKGIDINMAAYTSELGWLANPVSSHVQSAEMHNQAINSLGLLSARQTFNAVECLSLIVASALYASCQGVDLRVLHRTFIAAARAPSKTLIDHAMAEMSITDYNFDGLWDAFEESWYKHSDKDARVRCDKASEVLIGAEFLRSDPLSTTAFAQIDLARKQWSTLLEQSYTAHRDTFFQKPTTEEYLGQGTKIIYRFVRGRLGVPLHRGLVEHPVADDPGANMIDGRPKRTIGSWVSRIYEAVRDGSLFEEIATVFGALLEESGRGETAEGSNNGA